MWGTWILTSLGTLSGHVTTHDPELKIFVEELSSDTAVLQRLPTKKWAKSSFFLINVAKSVGNPE